MTNNNLLNTKDIRACYAETPGILGNLMYEIWVWNLVPWVVIFFFAQFLNVAGDRYKKVC